MSADEEIGKELARAGLIILAFIGGVIAFAVYAWHHVRWIS